MTDIDKDDTHMEELVKELEIEAIQDIKINEVNIKDLLKQLKEFRMT